MRSAALLCLSLVLAACSADDPFISSDAGLADGSAPDSRPPPPDGPVQPPATAHYINVGQGDAALLQTRGGLRLLVDCGPGGLAAQYLAGLLGKGATIHALIITHSDADHLGGCRQVLRDFNVRWVFTNGKLGQCGSATCKYLRDELKTHQLPGPCFTHTAAQDGTCEVQQDTTIHLGSGAARARLDFVVTYDTDPGLMGGGYIDSDGNDRNNASLMTRIHQGSVRFFYPGDCQTACQQEAVKTGGVVASEVALVPHHCRLTQLAPAFVKQAGSKVKVISTGAKWCVRQACLDAIKQPPAPPFYLTNECSGKSTLSHSQHVLVRTTDGKTVKVQAQAPKAPWGD